MNTVFMRLYFHKKYFSCIIASISGFYDNNNCVGFLINLVGNISLKLVDQFEWDL